jgi:putative ABC transport system permease protein
MTLFEDVRYAVRTLAKNPGFTIVAVIALGLGIGTNATVFTLTNGVLFKSTPFDRQDRILYVIMRNQTPGPGNINGQFNGVSYPDFRDWKAQVKSFEALSAYSQTALNLSDKNGFPEQFGAARVTADSFQTIGQKPVIGRDFSPADEKAGATAVAILGYGLWERRYGKDASVLGRTIRLNDVPTTVIGVMPMGLRFPGDSELWIPLTPNPNWEKRQSRNLTVFGRMAAGVSAKAAHAEMQAIGSRLESAYPETNKGFTPAVRTFSEQFNGPQITTMFLALLGAVGFVLLIACANVANLLLARAVGRTREISIRAALGASRWRVIRQLLVESVMLSVAGGVLGYLIAIWGVRTFDAVVIPLGKPPFIDFSMDYRVFVYLIAIALGTGVLFGLAPALRLSKLDVNNALKDGGRGASSGGRGKFLSGLLVVSEMALAVILLAGAGLMIRSFLNMYHKEIGVAADHGLVMRLFLPEAKYAKPEDQIAFHDRLHARLAALPGVESVAVANNMPTGGWSSFPYEFEGAAPVDEKKRPNLPVIVISPDYFRALDVKVLRGRSFSDSDTASSTAVAIVNQHFAEKFWPGDDPFAKRLRLFDNGSPGPWLTVVGVAADITQTGDATQTEHDAILYLPYKQKARRDMAIIARTRVPPETLGNAFRREVQTVDENLPVYNLQTLEGRLAQNRWAWRVFGGLFAIFAAIALLLASVGLYAVIAHSVNQRTQEIGVRMALGASGHSILGLVFGQGMLSVAIGLAVGLAGAFGVTRVLSMFLVQVSTADPVTYGTVAVLLATASALGCWIPARRAMTVDPVVALRHE